MKLAIVQVAYLLAKSDIAATCPLQVGTTLADKKAYCEPIGRTGSARQADIEFESETEVSVCGREAVSPMARRP